MSIQNLATYDPFADTGDDHAGVGGGNNASSANKDAAGNKEAGGKSSKADKENKDGEQELDGESRFKAPQDRYIHIRIQQRNGRKTLTTLAGLPKGEF